MRKMAAVGDFESVACFLTLGADTFYPLSGSEAKSILDRLKKEGYALVFLDGKYAELKKEYDKDIFPIIFVTGEKLVKEAEL